MTGEPELREDFLRAFGPIRAIIAREDAFVLNKLDDVDRSLIAEVAIYFPDLINKLGCNLAERNFARAWLDRCLSILFQDFKLRRAYFGHYFEKHYSEDPVSQVNYVISVLVELRALLANGVSLKDELTVMRFLERDIPTFRSVLDRILIRHAGDSPTHEWFLLLNALDALSYFRDSVAMTEESVLLKRITEREYDAIVASSSTFPGLGVYLEDIADRFALPRPSGLPEPDATKKSGVFRRLYKLRTGTLSVPEMDSCLSRPSSSPLEWLANALTRIAKGEKSTGILPYYASVEQSTIDTVMESLFGPSADISAVQVEQADLDRVAALDDTGVRSCLAQLVSKSPLLSGASRASLSLEQTKANAGAEISDFNLELVGASGRLFVAIPIKSGREVAKRKPEKVFEDEMHQFLRPFTAFGPRPAIVLVLLLAPSSLNLVESVTRVRAAMGLPLMLVDLTFFTKALKRAGVVPPTG